MKVSEIKSCYLGPHISPEQFIAEHFFLYLLEGSILGYDGHKQYVLHPNESCIVRKNHLARYSKQKAGAHFGKVVVIFDEDFLKLFLKKHPTPYTAYPFSNAFLEIKKNQLITTYVQSLHPYYRGEGKIDEKFTDLKREELLLILLQLHPGYSGVFFDFGKPGKIDLEAFMNKNYKFNISLGRFAYLSGRSISAFKRDFAMIFNETPGRWLVKRRLKEAHFLISKGKKPADIYLDLGFEDLSHFSFAFKKLFGSAPTGLIGNSQ